jgi:oligoribonuclease
MKKFFFLDLETTGLDAENCLILEVAAAITDNKLNVIETYTTPIAAPAAAIAAMDEWCKITHTQSRLLEEVRATKTTAKDAELALQRLKRKHFPVDKPAISGSSVHFDKRFIDKYMPALGREFNHRIIDVSSFMGALINYYDITVESKNTAHRALPDIYDSINYLKGYLERFKG